MQGVTSKTVVLLGLISVLMLSGCTDWKKKHDALNVEHQNLERSART